jgi:hypothetical protein
MIVVYRPSGQSMARNRRKREKEPAVEFAAQAAITGHFVHDSEMPTRKSLQRNSREGHMRRCFASACTTARPGLVERRDRQLLDSKMLLQKRNLHAILVVSTFKIAIHFVNALDTKSVHRLLQMPAEVRMVNVTLLFGGGVMKHKHGRIALRQVREYHNGGSISTSLAPVVLQRFTYAGIILLPKRSDDCSL